MRFASSGAITPTHSKIMSIRYKKNTSRVVENEDGGTLYKPVMSFNQANSGLPILAFDGNVAAGGSIDTNTIAAISHHIKIQIDLSGTLTDAWIPVSTTTPTAPP